MSLQVQFVTLAAMAGCGAILGACFDTIGVTVREFRLNRIVQAALDILYWAGAIWFVFRVLLAANDGEVRFFVFLGLAMGAIVYALVLGRALRKTVEVILRTLIRIVRAVAKAIYHTIIRPVLWIYKLVVRLLAFVAGFVATVAVFLAKVVVQWAKALGTYVLKRVKSRFHTSPVDKPKNDPEE